MSEYLVLALVGGLLALDERAGWQSLLSQPLFGGLLVGLLTGELFAGLQAGFLLELVWLSRLPMRGTRRIDQAAAVSVGVGSACLLLHRTGDPWSQFIIVIGCLVGLLTAVLGVLLLRPLDSIWEKYLAGFHPGERSAASRIARIQALRLFSIFASESIVVLILLPPAMKLVSWMSLAMRGRASGGVEFWGEMLPVFGIVALIQIYWHRYSFRFLLASIVLTLMVVRLW